jgi:hypothetical protein
MKPHVILGLLSCLFLIVACGGQASDASAAPTSSTPVPSSDAADASRLFAIDEIGLGSDGYVTLLNYTDVPASLDPAFLCQATGCVDLSDDTVEPGEVARIAVGDGSGLEAVVLRGAALELPPLDGEVGLYGSDDINDPQALRSYLQWGSTPHQLTQVAVTAGLWQETGYAPTGPNATRLWKTDQNLWVWDPGR